MQHADELTALADNERGDFSTTGDHENNTPQGKVPVDWSTFREFFMEERHLALAGVSKGRGGWREEPDQSEDGRKRV
jgi:hypothetical protein